MDDLYTYTDGPDGTENTTPDPLPRLLKIKLIVEIVMASVAAILVILIVLYIIYCNRWKIRWTFLLSKAKLKLRMHRTYNGYERLEMVSTEERRGNYHGYFVYDNPDEQWVYDHVIPKMEEESGLSLCLKNRESDAKPYLSMAENIVLSIATSRKTVLVVSPSFVKNDWCHFAVNMALTRSRAYLAICYLERIPQEDCTKELSFLLQYTNYMRWSDDTNKRTQFWQRLCNILTDGDQR